MAATGGGNAVGAYFLATLLHPAAAVGIAGTQLLTGKLLASPGFARVLARTAKMPPQASARSLKEQLGVLGTREPLLRGDLTKLIQKMQETVANSPGRAAADEKEHN